MILRRTVPAWSGLWRARRAGWFWLGILFAGVCGGLLGPGCGGPSGPARYEVQGAITYDGQPVPAGQIIFEPDPEHSNTGPPAYARIQQGRYQTEPGKGPVGGPHVVRILGTTGKPSPEMPQGQMLFPEYRLKVNLPRSDTVQNFEIPRSPAPGRPAGSR